jgi:hypothetical protein
VLEAEFRTFEEGFAAVVEQNRENITHEDRVVGKGRRRESTFLLPRFVTSRTVLLLTGRKKEERHQESIRW